MRTGAFKEWLDLRWRARFRAPESSSSDRSSPKLFGSLQPKILALVFMVASSLLGQTLIKDASVTPTEGPSWLNHLHRSFNETSMGKTWDLGPSPDMPRDEEVAWQFKLAPDFASQTITLHGLDLYRLSCQGCHGGAGLGAPPEINSVIGPVQSTSASFTMARMKKAGRDMSLGDANEIAKQSKDILQQRLHNGGQTMPAPNLSDPEIRALVPFLEQLSDIPGAPNRQVAIKESRERVGEHIVKSTCHVCHSATGTNPTPQQILNGAIPPLGTLTARVSLPDFVRKVTDGAPIVMGTPPTPYRGRMPVFKYLSQSEAADAYLYLIAYPPREPVEASDPPAKKLQTANNPKPTPRRAVVATNTP